MLSFLLPCALSHSGSFCGHGKIPVHHRFSNESEPLIQIGPDFFPNASIVRKPIRIEFDTRLITESDAYTCNESGQIIENYTCQAKDLLTPEKIKALKDTLSNIRTFLQKAITVDPNTKVLPLVSYDYLALDRENVSNVDLFIGFALRSNLSHAASGEIIQAENMTYRPLQAAIFLDPEFVPIDAENLETQRSKYFFYLLHEIIHVLGISKDYIKFWHPSRSPVLYEKDKVICSVPYTHHNPRSYIVTPLAHEMTHFYTHETTMIFNTTVQCPSGFETQYNDDELHLSFRTYNTEVMTDNDIQTDSGPYTRFTEISAILLIDSGYYNISWGSVKPIIWGSSGNLMEPIPSYLSKPPQETWPDNYYANDTSRDNKCGFDLHFIGAPDDVEAPINCVEILNGTVNSTEDEFEYCKNQKFYNPDNNEYIGNERDHDFLTYRKPSQVCPPNSACIPNTTICAPWYCPVNWAYFQWTYNRKVYKCSKAGQILDVEGINVACYSPQFMCRSAWLWGVYFSGEPFNGKGLVFKSMDIPKRTPIPSASSLPNAVVAGGMDGGHVAAIVFLVIFLIILLILLILWLCGIIICPCCVGLYACICGCCDDKEEEKKAENVEEFSEFIDENGKRMMRKRTTVIKTTKVQKSVPITEVASVAAAAVSNQMNQPAPSTVKNSDGTVVTTTTSSQVKIVPPSKVTPAAQSQSTNSATNKSSSATTTTTTTSKTKKAEGSSDGGSSSLSSSLSSGDENESSLSGSSDVESSDAGNAEKKALKKTTTTKTTTTRKVTTKK